MTHTSFFETPSNQTRLQQLEPAIAKAWSVPAKFKSILLETLLTTEAGLLWMPVFIVAILFWLGGSIRSGFETFVRPENRRTRKLSAAALESNLLQTNEITLP